MGSIPQLPRILLGFAPDQPPEFEDSITLRHKAARRLGITVEQLAMNDPVLLERLLRDVWERQLIVPHTVNNPTRVFIGQISNGAVETIDQAPRIGGGARSKTRASVPGNPRGEALG